MLKDISSYLRRRNAFVPWKFKIVTMNDGKA